MSEKYEAMTVLELRRVAKEMGVKLGAGISKQGIIDKLSAAAAVAPAGDPPHTEEAAAVAAPEEDAPEAQPQPAAPVRHAAIARAKSCCPTASLTNPGWRKSPAYMCPSGCSNARPRRT